LDAIRQIKENYEFNGEIFGMPMKEKFIETMLQKIGMLVYFFEEYRMEASI
jgi:hypothetical protein